MATMCAHAAQRTITDFLIGEQLGGLAGAFPSASTGPTNRPAAAIAMVEATA